MFEYWKKLTKKPLLEDHFLIDGRLSTNQFTKAGDHLCDVCTGWKWKPSLNSANTCSYLDKDKQYLVFQNAICKRRIGEPKQQNSQIIKDENGDQIIVLKNNQKQQEINDEDIRKYNMYIVYDEYYHCPRMSFTAVGFNGLPISNEDIRQDIQKEYLDQTLTVEQFPFFENVYMATVHPCKHSNVLKSMSDTMKESGQLIQSRFALLIFMKFIASVIPYVEFDSLGDLHLGFKK